MGEEAEHVGPNDEVLVVGRIDIEVPIVDASPKHCVVIGDRNDAVPILDNVLHVTDFGRFSTENHNPIKIAVCGGREADRCNG